MSELTPEGFAVYPWIFSYGADDEARNTTAKIHVQLVRREIAESEGSGQEQ